MSSFAHQHPVCYWRQLDLASSISYQLNGIYNVKVHYQYILATKEVCLIMIRRLAYHGFVEEQVKTCRLPNLRSPKP